MMVFYIIQKLQMSEQEKINWVSVINFLEKQYSNITIREKQWLYEKQILTQRINSLEGELRSNVIICQDLVNRIKVLQIALKEEKSKKGSSRDNLEEDKVKALIEKYKLTQQLDKDSHEEFLQKIVKDLRMTPNHKPRIIQKQNDALITTFSKVNDDKHFQEHSKSGAHLDVITNLVTFECSQQGMFATSSEDCLIKIWKTAKIIKQDNPEPVHTLRKHTGPLFALTCCRNPFNDSEALLFSGGIEGDIKAWKVDKKNIEWVKNWMNGHQEEQTIWELQTYEDKLLSSSSDGFVRLFKIEGLSTDLAPLKSFKEKQFNQTAIKWLSKQHFFAASSSAPRINLWNVEGSIVSKSLYQIQKGKDASCAQVNKLEVGSQRKILIGGCQDGFVRFFDINNGKIIKKVPMKNAVSSVLMWDSVVVAGDHGGNLCSWDMRTFRPIQEKQAVHNYKYDCGITSLARSGSYLLSAGADGLVKSFI